MAVVEVAFEDLADYLSGLSAGTYKLNITGLNQDVLNSSNTKRTLGYVIRNNIPEGVLLDLSETIIPDSVTDMSYTFFNCTSLTEAPVIPDSVTNMSGTFFYCISLTSAPVIPNSVTNMSYTFYNCTSLKEAPVIPDSVTSGGYTFYNCTSLITIGLWDISEDNIIKTYSSIFYNCNSLETINTSNLKQEKLLEDLLTTWQTESSDNFPSSLVVKDVVKSLTNKIPFSYLNTWLSAQDSNTTDTPYEINVTELTQTELEGTAGTPSTDLTTLQSVLYNNSDKYISLEEDEDSFDESETEITSLNHCFKECTTLVSLNDLSYLENLTALGETFSNCISLTEAPVIPDSVTDMSGTFYNCTSLTEAPVIPNSVTNMSSTFSNCESLTSAPVIPDSVTDMSYTFYNCTSLTSAPVIPDSVTNMSETFSGCTSLTIVQNVPSSVTDLSNAFSGCTNLKAIYNFNVSKDCKLTGAFKNCTSLTEIYTNESIPQADRWRVYDVHYSTDEDTNTDYATVTIYNVNDLENPISVTAFDITNGRKIYINSYTDELIFSEDESVTEEKIKTLIKYKCEMTTDMSDKVEASGDNFMLIAKDTSKVTTNLSLSNFTDDLSLTDEDFDEIFEEE